MNHTRFKRVTPEEVGIPSEAVEWVLDKLEWTDGIEPHGLMIMRNGKICVEGWWAPYAAGVPHALFSITKTYTATAVGIAYTQGLLDLNDKILDYFPEYRHVDTGKWIQEMTLHDTLTMCSGKAEIRDNSTEWRRHFFKIPIKDKPGTRFEYSCEDTHICMAIVQKVTGQHLHDYLKVHLFDKIGIDTKKLKWIYMPDGSEAGCGGLFATTEDNLRLMNLYLQGGVWEGERILAADYVEKAVKTQISTGNASARTHHREMYFADSGYGYQIWTGDEIGAYCAAGSLGQSVVVVPALDMVIAFNQTMNDTPFRYVLGDILGILLPAAHSKPLPENFEASSRLRKRLQSLSLGNPESFPCSDRFKHISGQKYEITEGCFTLRDGIWEHVTIEGAFPEAGEPLPQVDGMDWFAMKYITPGECSLVFREGGEEFTLQIGLDGVRRLNSLALPHTSIDQVVLDGAWIDSDRFKLNARWIETCYSITVIFYFLDNNHVEISLEQISGDYKRHPLRNGKVVARLSK